MSYQVTKQWQWWTNREKWKKNGSYWPLVNTIIDMESSLWPYVTIWTIRSFSLVTQIRWVKIRNISFAALIRAIVRVFNVNIIFFFLDKIYRTHTMCLFCNTDCWDFIIFFFYWHGKIFEQRNINIDKYIKCENWIWKYIYKSKSLSS